MYKVIATLEIKNSSIIKLQFNSIINKSRFDAEIE